MQGWNNPNTNPHSQIIQYKSKFPDDINVIAIDAMLKCLDNFDNNSFDGGYGGGDDNDNHNHDGTQWY